MTRGEKKFAIIFCSIFGFVGFWCLMFFLLLNSCASELKKDPFRHYGVKWTCTEPEIVFTINSRSYYYDQKGEDGYAPKKTGYLMVGEEKIEVYWHKTHKHELEISRLDNDKCLILGSFTFNTYTNTLTVNVYEHYQDVYDHKYETLTFIMTKLDK